MRVPAEISKCVVFACMQSDRGYRLVGTAFLLGRDVDIDGETCASYYMVTAKHVVAGAKRDSLDGKLWLRMNTREEGGMTLVETDLDHWISDEYDPYIDVAVCPFPFPEYNIDHLALPESMIVTEEVIEREIIGVGDAVFLTGLFVNHSGQQRNIPIVRSGAIASMPVERVKTSFGGYPAEIDAYLIEVRSIGGLSGSPVFVHLPPIYVKDGGVMFRTDGYGQQFLLGLVHGHWDVRQSSQDAIALDNLQSEALNMGIAIAVPATKIQALFSQPTLAAQTLAATDAFRANRKREAKE
jgi:hypothetical protein